MTTSTGVFTPLNADRTFRHHFEDSEVEVLSGDIQSRGYGKRGTVRIRGVVYDVIGLACSLPSCACDAYIREVA